MFEGKKIIVYELNEVPLKVFEWFKSKYPQSAIATLLRDGAVVKTYSEDEGHLSPWITWPTLHRGVTNVCHQIYDFGQDLTEANEIYPPVWELIARAGRKVGIFGSLHSYPLPSNLENYSFYVPDTFAAGPECFPKNLSTFQEFNLRMMDRSGRNVSRGLPLRDAAKFLVAAPSLGLRGITMAKLAAQLAAEKTTPTRIVRRRTCQVQIAFDLFIESLTRTRPDYAAFFTNHVASSMHRYWPALFPEDYANRFWDDQWQRNWRDEIPFTMREADEQLKRLLRFLREDPQYALVVVTSMGQAAQQGQESIESQLNFFDVQRFMRLLGIADDQWHRERAMAPIYMLRVHPGLANDFACRAAQVTINGTPISIVSRGEGVFRVELGHCNLSTNSVHLKFGNRSISLDDAGMVNLRIQDEAGSNAYHVPEGVLIAYGQSGHASISREISTLQIAPALLANFEISAPRHMTGSATAL